MAWNGRPCGQCNARHESEEQRRACNRSYQREWQRQRKAETGDYSERASRLWRRYGITPRDYDRMLVAQDGLCRICRRQPRRNMLAVDHDHDTGAVRGLLCVPCNTNLTWFERYGAQAEEYLRGNLV